MSANLSDVPTIAVTGFGTVTAQADELTLALAVTAVTESGPDALARAAPRAEALALLFDELGIPETDRGGTGISLGPNQVQEAGAWKEHGWQATYRVRLRLNSENLATQLVAAAAERAGARIEHSSWRFSESHEARDDVLRRAVEDAKRRAAVMAESVGMTLGRLLHASDRTDRFGGVVFQAGGAATPQLHAGTIELSTTVELTYALDD
jgi:uncharacterized protein